MSCSGCYLDLPITNKTHNLCANCSSIRNTGKSLAERQSDSAKKFRSRQFDKSKEIKPHREGNGRNLSSVKEPNNKIIRPVTTKQSSLNSQLSLVKKSIELEAIQNGEYYCQGCGKSFAGLDKSHILSIGQYKHLELDKDNIQLMCRDCHTIWEYGSIEEQMILKCFVSNLEYIYKHDQNKFNRFITKLDEYSRWQFKGINDDKILIINNVLDKISEFI